MTTQNLYDSIKRICKKYAHIPDNLLVRQQLWNLFATDMSPGLLLITQHYQIEITGKDVTYEHDRLKQGSWLIKNNCRLKHVVIATKEMRNGLVHHRVISTSLLHECAGSMLELYGADGVPGKKLIGLILDGLIIVCNYLEGSTACMTCPLCNNTLTDNFATIDTLNEETFSTKEYSLNELKDTLLKEKLKSRKIQIKSGKNIDRTVKFKSWSGTSAKVSADSNTFGIPIRALVCIPVDLEFYLMDDTN